MKGVSIFFPVRFFSFRVLNPAVIVGVKQVKELKGLELSIPTFSRSFLSFFLSLTTFCWFRTVSAFFVFAVWSLSSFVSTLEIIFLAVSPRRSSGHQRTYPIVSYLHHTSNHCHFASSLFSYPKQHNNKIFNLDEQRGDHFFLFWLGRVCTQLNTTLSILFPSSYS